MLDWENLNRRQRRERRGTILYFGILFVSLHVRVCEKITFHHLPWASVAFRSLPNSSGVSDGGVRQITQMRNEGFYPREGAQNAELKLDCIATDVADGR